MRKFITTLATGALLFFGLAAIPAPVQAHPWAYTYINHNYKGLNRVISVQCHSPLNQWRALGEGMNSKQVCGDNGWVMRVWVDSDVNFCAASLGSSNYQYWGSGQLVAVPGSYNAYVTKGGCL